MRLHLFNQGHRPHLLCVAGSKPLAEAMARAAAPEHFETSIAASRAEVLQSRNAYGFAGYVIDANLPDAHGAELVCDLREAKVAVPILFIDSLAGTSSVKNAADVTLTKPLSLPEFRATLQELFLSGDAAPDAPASSLRGMPSFHLSTLIIPVLLAGGIALTCWLLSLS
jgi:DNA-binding response OmpR family regulator